MDAAAGLSLDAPAAEAGRNEDRRERRPRRGERREEGRTDAAPATDERSDAMVEGASAAAVESDATDGDGRRRRRRGGRGRNRDGAVDAGVEGQTDANDGTAAPHSAPDATTVAVAEVQTDAAPAPAVTDLAPTPTPTAAESAEVVNRAADDRSPAEAPPAETPAAAVPAAVVEVPAPAPAEAAPYSLPLNHLEALAREAGLEWVQSDAQKVQAAQEAIANTPAPVRVPRTPKAVVVVDEGPLVLVETRKDLASVRLPFETEGAQG